MYENGKDFGKNWDVGGTYANKNELGRICLGNNGIIQSTHKCLYKFQLHMWSVTVSVGGHDPHGDSKL